MYDVLAVHEPQPLQDLLHELDSLTLQQVLLFSNEVKQLPSSNTENRGVSYSQVFLLF